MLPLTLVFVSLKANKEVIGEAKYFSGDFSSTTLRKNWRREHSPPPQTRDHEPLMVHVVMGGKGMQGLDSCGHGLLIRAFDLGGDDRGGTCCTERFPRQRLRLFPFSSEIQFVPSFHVCLKEI